MVGGSAFLVLSNVDKLESTQELLRSLAEREKVLVIAYSGGKDSTVVLDLAIKTILNNNFRNKIVILHGNTLVENPIIHNHASKVINKVQSFLLRRGIEVEVKICKPEKDRTFWVNLIGKGYPLPNHRFRWCQKHLKIKPAEKAISEVQEGIMLLGMRLDESIDRKRSMLKRIDGFKIGYRGNLPVYAPLAYWTEEEVWEYLLEEKSPWGEDYFEVIRIYKEARGECPLIPDNKASSACGSRFGCWVCTLVREDKSLKNQIKHNQTLAILYEFRNWLINFCNKPENRTGYNRKGKYLGYGKGTLTTQARKQILEKLEKLQEDTKMELISREEKDVILSIIEQEGLQTKQNL